MFVVFAVLFILFGLIFGVWAKPAQSGKVIQSVICAIFSIIWGGLAIIFVYGAMDANIQANAPYLALGVLPFLIGFIFKAWMDKRFTHTDSMTTESK